MSEAVIALPAHQAGSHEKLVAAALAKNVWRLIPVLGLAYLFNYLDRTSVGFAALQMNQAIGLSATQFGWGAGILFLATACWRFPAT